MDDKHWQSIASVLDRSLDLRAKAPVLPLRTTEASYNQVTQLLRDAAADDTAARSYRGFALCLSREPARRFDARSAQAEAIGSELLQGRVRVERGKSQLVETLHKIEHGWRTAIGLLKNQGHSELAAFVARFVDEMPPPATEKELVARVLVEHLHLPALRRAPPVRSR